MLAVFLLCRSFKSVSKSTQFQMKQPLTVIVPCKDEQINICSCIESFVDVADEILIADSGSTDATLELAKQFPKVRIIEREYITSGDFKNWAIPKATHEWVLIVDADERLTPELADEIRLELSRGPMEDGYWIYRTNHFMGHELKFGDARTDKVLRFFHRDKGRYVGPSDHGEVEISTGRVGTLQSRFLHFTYWDYDQIFAKMQRYTTVQAAQWHDAGKDTSYFKLIVRPWFRFFRELILQGGILDGKRGIQTAWLAAFYSFMKQGKLWTLNHGKPNPDEEVFNMHFKVFDDEDRRAA